MPVKPPFASLLRQPAPHSVESERTVVGALLLDGEAIGDVRDLLEPHDFFDPVFRRIYAAVCDLYDDRKPVDFVTVAAALRHQKQLDDVGGSAFLAELSKDVPTASHARHYAETVRQYSLKRQLVAAGKAIAEYGGDDGLPPDLALHKAEQEILAIAPPSSRNRPHSIGSVASEFYEYQTALHEADEAAKLLGIRTGFADLDERLIGFRPGDLIVLAARPSMGKTTLAIDITLNVALRQEKHVLFCSLEMDRMQIMARIAAGHLELDATNLQRGRLSDSDFSRLSPLLDEFDKCKTLHIDDAPDSTLNHIRRAACRHQIEHGLDLLVVDYLQLIELTTRRENRTQEVSYISRSLKRLARDLHCPVLALAQLNRAAEGRPDRQPHLSDLRDSGTIEQDADVVLMLYREDYYNEDTDRSGVTDVFIRKNRNGKVGTVELMFEADKTRFVDSSTTQTLMTWLGKTN